MSKRRIVDFAVGGQKGIPGRFVGLDFDAAELRRYDKSRFSEILIARRFRLPVPELLILDFGGGKLRNPLEAEDDVAEIGDRCVAVLEVEAFEELRRIVGAHPR